MSPRRPKNPQRPSTPDMEDDSDSNHELSHPEEGRGGKSSSSSVRKAQNRIAQREFRLRKQQYVRDLEARVEVLSADKEDRGELMTLLIRNLLKENKELRDMVKTMASFVGEGLGSCLPRLGLSAPQLDAILNRADTDTAHEAFLALKASREMQKDHPGLPLGSPRRRASTVKRKRSSAPDAGPDSAPSATFHPPTSETPDENNPPRIKRQGSSGFTSYDYLFPDLNSFASHPPPVPEPVAGSSDGSNPQNVSNAQQPQPSQQPTSWGTPYPPQQSGGQSNIAYSPHPVPQQLYQSPQPVLQNNLYTQPFHQSGFGLTVPGSLPHPQTPYPPHPQNYMHQPMHPTHVPSGSPSAPSDEAGRKRQLKRAVAIVTSHENQGTMPGSMTPEQVEERRRMQEDLKSTMEKTDLPDADRKAEAVQLITYHLSNFRINHAYTLPASLRPTKVQQTIPHEYAIDGIIFPSIRDRMILLRGRYDLAEAYEAILHEFTIHGQDMLDHRNWEVSEKWLRDYKFLVDDEVYDITNGWRSRRGESILVRPDIGMGPGLTQDAWGYQNDPHARGS